MDSFVTVSSITTDELINKYNENSEELLICVDNLLETIERRPLSDFAEELVKFKALCSINGSNGSELFDEFLKELFVKGLNCKRDLVCCHILNYASYRFIQVIYGDRYCLITLLELGLTTTLKKILIFVSKHPNTLISPLVEPLRLSRTQVLPSFLDLLSLIGSADITDVPIIIKAVTYLRNRPAYKFSHYANIGMCFFFTLFWCIMALTLISTEYTEMVMKNKISYCIILVMLAMELSYSLLKTCIILNYRFKYFRNVKNLPEKQEDNEFADFDGFLYAFFIKSLRKKYKNAKFLPGPIRAENFTRLVRIYFVFILLFFFLLFGTLGLVNESYQKLGVYIFFVLEMLRFVLDIMTTFDALIYIQIYALTIALSFRREVFKFGVIFAWILISYTLLFAISILIRDLHYPPVNGTTSLLVTEGRDDNSISVISSGFLIFLTSEQVYNENFLLSNIYWLTAVIYIGYMFLLFFVLNNIFTAQILDTYIAIKDKSECWTAWFRLRYVMELKSWSPAYLLYHFIEDRYAFYLQRKFFKSRNSLQRSKFKFDKTESKIRSNYRQRGSFFYSCNFSNDDDVIPNPQQLEIRELDIKLLKFEEMRKIRQNKFEMRLVNIENALVEILSLMREDISIETPL